MNQEYMMKETHPGAGQHMEYANSDSSRTKYIPEDYGNKEEEQEPVADLETIHTFERVGTHAQYYEKEGLRTEGDGIDHIGQHQKKLNFKTFMAFVALSFLWTSSQIPVYLFGGIPPEIYSVLGGEDRWIWMILSNLLALAAVCPFVGAMSDLLGRRYVAIMGACLIIIGMIVCSTATKMNNFIGGMAIAGVGAGINELTALAGTSELAPTSKRGFYVGMMVFTILPWCPSVLYAQLINSASNFRYVGLVCGVWAFIGLVMTLCFYFPPPRPNSKGYSRKEILKRIDYVGGFLSIGGVLTFLMGLEWGGYNYGWKTAHVLVPLILGACLIIAYIFWEWKGARYPMVPKRLGKNPRILVLTLVITFISGFNFFSILFFWPTQAFNMYGNDPVGVGLRGLPIGFAILLGAVLVLFLLSITGGQIRLLLVLSSIVMTAGVGAMSIATPVNLPTMWGILIVAGLGIGGIVVPASIVTTIICPDDLIATITALSLSIRVLGGAIGYTIYWNVFYPRFVTAATQIVGIEALVEQLGVYNGTLITEIVTLAGNAEFALLRQTIDAIPGGAPPYAYDVVIEATQWAFADAYKWVYYVSIAFGVVSIIASACLGDIKKYMDDHVAVVYE